MIRTYIFENEPRMLDELFSLIRIPSISAKPEHHDEMLACAERWRQLLLEAGADEAMVMPSQGNPMVFAQKTVNPKAKTVLIYAHYDLPNRWNYGKAPPLNPKYATATSGPVVPTTTKDSRLSR